MFKLFVLAGLFQMAVAAAAVAAPSPAVLLEGKPAVTEADLADWQAAQACYGEGAITSRKAALMRQLEAAVMERVLADVRGSGITSAEYAAETARIDAQTKAPIILACVKKVLGGGERYRKVFLRPILAAQYARQAAAGDKKIQAGAYALRDRAAAAASSGEFSGAGAGDGVAYSTSCYSLEPDTAALTGGAHSATWAPFEAAFIKEYLQDLLPGQALAKPIETDREITFLRLNSVTGKKYCVESLLVKKISFEEYLKARKKLPCEIKDAELRSWAAGIRGNPILEAVSIR